MSVLVGNPFFLGAGASAGGGGYQIERSLRFNTPDNSFLSRTPASAGNKKTWTWAGWVKRSRPTFDTDYLIGCYFGGSLRYEYLAFTPSDSLDWFSGLYTTGGSTTTSGRRITTAVYRDTSAWYHIVLAKDTTQATAANRVKLYVNGVEVTTFSTSTDPAQNDESFINATDPHRIGSLVTTTGFYGYLADVHFIDGQALTPSDFTEVSATTGQLIPKEYTGTFGTNGFWLKFSDNSAATATTLGKDYSGNSNNWTPNNLSIGGITYSSATNGNTPVYDIQIGPTNDLSGTYVWSNAFDANGSTIGLIGPITFINTKPTWSTSAGVQVMAAGNGITATVNGGTQVACTNGGWTTISTGSSGTLNSIWVYSATGESYFYGVRVDGVEIAVRRQIDDNKNNDSLVDTPTSYGTPDTGVGGQVRGNYCTWNPLVYSSGLSNGALDVAANQARGTQNIFDYQCYWEITSTGGNTDAGIQKADGSQNSVTIASGKTYGFRTGSRSVQYINITDGGSWTTWLTSANVGLTEPYFPYVSGGAGAVSTLNAGQRAFAAAAPSGYKALCDTNLTAPTIAKPSTVMDVKLYTGNGSTQTISGLGFSPDFLWFKARSISYSHALYDTVRGYTKSLVSNSTVAEGTEAGGLSAFNSDGFSLNGENTVYGSTNTNGQTYVAWAWDAGSSTVTNTQGSITSQVRANASAGFSIVTYTGTGANATVGHGLGVAPQMIIVKSRNSVTNWGVGHSSIGWGNALRLNTTDASSAQATFWNSTAPTSTVFSIGTGPSTNNSGDGIVAYCFSPVAGYSSFGSYTGNGSASGDGPFVYTGFRPKWLMFKKSSASGDNWVIVNSAISPYNLVNQILYPNTSDAQTQSGTLDFLSNGFKLRTDDSYCNASGATYVWAAFAENPFQYARAR